MRRTKKLNVYAINIKMHPTVGKRDYEGLFRLCWEQRMFARMHGDTYGMVGSLYGEEENEDVLLYGSLYRFTSIDPHAEWLNMEVFKPVDGEEARVPEHLKPNLRQIPYVFSVEHHRLFWPDSIKGSPTPRVMHSFLEKLFAAEMVESKFQKIDVEIETRKEDIMQIIQGYKKFRRLDIAISLPNDDNLDELEEEIIERMRRRRIERVHNEYASRKGIEPDDELKAEMSLAAGGNGRLKAEGLADDGSIMRVSSEEHPRLFPLEFLPEKENVLSAMKRLAVNWSKSLAGKQ